MNASIRVLLEYVIIAVILVLLVIENPQVNGINQFFLIEPFLLMGVFFALVVVVLILRSPGPGDHIPVWKFWHWVHPFDLAMGGTSLITSIYYLVIYLGLSQRAEVPAWTYDWLRGGSWLAGFLGLPILIELAFSAIKARRDGHTETLENYERNEFPPEELP